MEIVGHKRTANDLSGLSVFSDCPVSQATIALASPSRSGVVKTCLHFTYGRATNVVTAAACRPRRNHQMKPTDSPGAAPAENQNSQARAQPSTHPGKPNSARRRTRKKKTSTQDTTARPGSKTSKILRLLQRPSGATLGELRKATGWQAHSLRGFLSGVLKKRMALHLRSAARENGERAYCLPCK